MNNLKIIMLTIAIIYLILPAIQIFAMDHDRQPSNLQKNEHEQKETESTSTNHDLLITKDVLNEQFLKNKTLFLLYKNQKYLNKVNVLLATKADVDTPYSDGFTPLLSTTEAISIKNVHKKIVHTLLVHKANVNAHILGNTALLNILSHPDNTPEKYRTIIAKQLITHKANIHAMSTCGQSALGNAIAYNHQEIVKTLIVSHADINGPCDESQKTPLTKILWSDQYESNIVKTLILAGADLDHQDDSAERHTPFYLITHHKYLPIQKDVAETLHEKYNFIEETLIFKKYIQHLALFHYLPITHLVVLVGDYFMPSCQDNFIHYLNQQFISKTNDQLITEQTSITKWLKKLTKEHHEQIQKT